MYFFQLLKLEYSLVSLCLMIVNWIYLGFGLLVGQKKQFEYVNLGNANLRWPMNIIFDIL